jgi:hypothetical protein
MTATFTQQKRADGKFVSHSLEFDLVAVADTEAEATEKIRLAVKIYIEYGLAQGWEDDIIFPAPQHSWDRLTSDSQISLAGPIEINDHRPERRVFLYRAMNAQGESPRAALQAS